MTRRGEQTLVVRLAALLMGIALLGGCTSAASGGQDEPRNSAPATTSKPPAKPASLTLSVRDGAKNFEPREHITAKVERGTIVDAKIVGTHGAVVGGTVSQDGTEWWPKSALGYGRTYTLIAKATGEDGKTVTKKAKFTTATPSSLAEVGVNVDNGDTVGVGMPLEFTFDQDIQDKAAAERALNILSEPYVEGAFHWFADDRVTWRPRAYWPSGTKVKIKADLYGVDLGGGTYGSGDETIDFTVGRKVAVIADGRTHYARVFVNDKQVRRMPISMGKPGNNTPSGMYTVMSEHNGYTMDSGTYGVPADTPGGYRITVDTAVRLSWSGIFYHSAPWSVGYQGNTNTSHGCINLSPADATWLMNLSKPGDLFRVQNSGGPILEPTDGWGYWQMSWKDWRSGQQS